MSDYEKTPFRCWAEIDSGALRHNLSEIKKHIPDDSSLLTVVKADAYGHGAARVARICLQEGARYLAVAFLEEALELREEEIDAPILILSACPPERAAEMILSRLTVPVSTAEEAKELSRAVEEAWIHTPALAGKKLTVHIKIDSGMARLGFSAREGDQAGSADAIAAACRLPGLEAEGIFTHFATASAPDLSYRDLQYKRFMGIIAALEQKGIHFSLRHCANSAAILSDAGMCLDMVRAGIILYGGRDGEQMRKQADLWPVMALRARLSTIRELKAGEGISYGLTYTCPRDMRVGVLECGYADGLHRRLSNRARFSLRGKEIRQIGRICMDRCMVDLSGLPEARIGDTVTIWGKADQDFVDPEEQAQRADTISYELFCAVSKRVPRIGR